MEEWRDNYLLVGFGSGVAYYATKTHTGIFQSDIETYRVSAKLISSVWRLLQLAHMLQSFSHREEVKQTNEQISRIIFVEHKNAWNFRIDYHLQYYIDDDVIDIYGTIHMFTLAVI